MVRVEVEVSAGSPRRFGGRAAGSGARRRTAAEPAEPRPRDARFDGLGTLVRVSSEGVAVESASIEEPHAEGRPIMPGESDDSVESPSRLARDEPTLIDSPDGPGL